MPLIRFVFSVKPLSQSEWIIHFGLKVFNTIFKNLTKHDFVLKTCWRQLNAFVISEVNHKFQELNHATFLSSIIPFELRRPIDWEIDDNWFRSFLQLHPLETICAFRHCSNTSGKCWKSTFFRMHSCSISYLVAEH